MVYNVNAAVHVTAPWRPRDPGGPGEQPNAARRRPPPSWSRGGPIWRHIAGQVAGRHRAGAGASATGGGVSSCPSPTPPGAWRRADYGRPPCHDSQSTKIAATAVLTGAAGPSGATTPGQAARRRADQVQVHYHAGRHLRGDPDLPVVTIEPGKVNFLASRRRPLTTHLGPSGGLLLRRASAITDIGFQAEAGPSPPPLAEVAILGLNVG